MSRARRFEAVSSIKWLMQMNKPWDALKAVVTLFETPVFPEWDDQYDRAVRLAMKVALETNTRIPTVMKSMAGMLQKAMGDPMTPVVLGFFQDYRSHIFEADNCAKYAPKVSYRPVKKEALDDWFMGVFLDFGFGMVTDVLRAISGMDRMIGLSCSLLERAFHLAADVSSRKHHAKLSRDVDRIARDRKLKVASESLVLSLNFVRYKAAVHIGMSDAARWALVGAQEFIESHALLAGSRDELEIRKTVLLQYAGLRHLAAYQMSRQIAFYESKPVDPPIPIEMMRDLAMLTELVSLLDDNVDHHFERLMGRDIPSRDDLLADMLQNARGSALRRFVASAEVPKDPELIYKQMLGVINIYGEVYNMPELYEDVRRYTAVRIVQAVASDHQNISLTALTSMIPCMDIHNVHGSIRRAIDLGLVQARIDMMTDEVFF